MSTSLALRSVAIVLSIVTILHAQEPQPTPMSQPSPDNIPVSGTPSADPNAPVSPQDPALTQRVVPNYAFGAGERLVFTVEFLGINAGHATLEIPEVVDLDGHKAFRLISESKTNSFFEKVYPVLNRYESYIDIQRLCSLKYVENQQERSTIRERFSVFDQARHLATVTRLPRQKKGQPENTNPPKIETAETPPFVQDVLSALYYLRTQDLKVGGEYRVPAISGTKTYELVVTVPRKRTIKTPVGKFQTLELIPELKYEGLFINKGKSYVYVTDDARKMPVLLKSKVAIGSFKAILTQKEISNMSLPEPPTKP